MKRRKYLPILVYLLLWLLSLALFWLWTGPGDEMGYALLVFYLLLPLAAVVVSFLVGRSRRWGRERWLVPVLLGALYMLSGYLTFDLAYMRYHGRMIAPSPKMMLAGLLLSAVPLAVGRWTSRK